MRRKLLKIVLISLITCSFIVATPIFPSLFFSSGVVAQSNEAQKAEADKLLDKGIQQAQTSQLQEAIQSWETALKIYREIEYRKGEASSLNNLGLAYYSLGQYHKAI